MGRGRVGRVFTQKIGLAALLVATAASTIAQEKTFSVDVRLVRVLATVKNASGQLIGNLRKEDFDLVDNGAPQEIRVFEKYTAQPLSIALMIDTSGSTAKDLRYELDSVKRFLQALFREGNPDDRVSLFSFNWEVRQQTRFTRNVSAMDRTLKALKAEAGTAMYDAICLATQELEPREGRHVMVLVTDGGDTTSSRRYHDALEAAHTTDTVVYAIVVMPITNDAGRNIGGENALTTIAASTGGRVFMPSDNAGLDKALDEILRDLRTQYLIGYYPKNTNLTKDRFHRIELKTKNPDLRVVSRTGYYGEAIPPSR